MMGKDNRGISLIELLVGITVLAAVGLMAGAFLGMSVRMEKKTLAAADIQQESYSVVKRLSDSIMSAENIYICQDESGAVICTGTRAAAVDKVRYSGETFFFDREGHSMYQMKNGDFELDGTASLSSDAVRTAMSNKKYLISDMVDEIDFQVEINGRSQSRGEGALAEKGHATVTFQVDFSRKGQSAYTSISGATTRNLPGEVWFK